MTQYCPPIPPHLLRGGDIKGWSGFCSWKGVGGRGDLEGWIGLPPEAPGHLSSLHLRLSLTQAPSHSPPSQVFSDAQQLQPLQVYQAPLSLSTVSHQALGRTQSSPAAPGGMKSPPDQLTKHLFTTGRPHRCRCPSTLCQGPVHGVSPVGIMKRQSPCP